MPTQHFGVQSKYGLENHGLYNLRSVYWNMSPPSLIEQAVLRDEGQIAHLGAFVVSTGKHTGRSPNDKFFVKNDLEDEEIYWSKENKPISPEHFNKLYQKVIAYLQGRDVFVQDMMVGAHPDHRLPIRVVSERAWASLFAHNMFIRLTPEQIADHVPDFTILHCPELQANPEEDGTTSSTFIVVDLTKKLILIGASGYAGEIKKSIFTIQNFLLPRKGIMSMHCSANIGKDGDVALFFGLSGTGKTTLSSDPDRHLIGDDEHGWTSEGVFNFEGGCYAKTIRLSAKYEPIIYHATRRFGTILENVVVDPHTRIPDFDSSKLTENTRASYPIHFVDNYVPEGYGGHPKNVFFLTADAFGVMPPLARLTTDQAIYYFLAGYTSKLAGTEVGLGNEPQATFSMCFGSPFMPLSPNIYAQLLGKYIKETNANVWLVNTGWTGGPFGVGKRFNLPYTRSMVKAAMENKLDEVPMRQEPFFGLWIPEQCPDVPSEVLDPQKTWQDKSAYVQKARELIGRFQKNFEKFEGVVSVEVMKAGPQLNTSETLKV
jgi:phosphoenolpyruvate carboxykinase (ATP)